MPESSGALKRCSRVSGVSLIERHEKTSPSFVIARKPSYAQENLRRVNGGDVGPEEADAFVTP